MSKYNAQSVYGTLFSMLDKLSENDESYLMENVFNDEFLKNVKENPKKAYESLDIVAKSIEDGKDEFKMLDDYKDKIYMMKSMLKEYGNLSERHERLMSVVQRLREKQNGNEL